jgi:hypothetical protein
MPANPRIAPKKHKVRTTKDCPGKTNTQSGQYIANKYIPPKDNNSNSGGGSLRLIKRLHMYDSVCHSMSIAEFKKLVQLSSTIKRRYKLSI